MLKYWDPGYIKKSQNNNIKQTAPLINELNLSSQKIQMENKCKDKCFMLFALLEIICP